MSQQLLALIEAINKRNEQWFLLGVVQQRCLQPGHPPPAITQFLQALLFPCALGAKALQAFFPGAVIKPRSLAQQLELSSSCCWQLRRSQAIQPVDANQFFDLLPRGFPPQVIGLSFEGFTVQQAGLFLADELQHQMMIILG